MSIYGVLVYRGKVSREGEWSEFFVHAGISLLHDGETGFFGICDGNRCGDFGHIHQTYLLANRVFAIQTTCQRFAVYRPHQFKTFAANPARLLRVVRVFRDVLVYWHKQARVTLIE